MALPQHGAMSVDFWRDEQKLNVFRTTRCQRLAVEGNCQWGSKCQFSHCLDWPRRQPRKHRYSPELCPSIGQADVCTKGINCPYAHSMEEVLFHPDLFKTMLCGEQGRARRNKDVGKPNRCHRYYCPFAHGKKELRESQYTQEQLEAFIQALEKFPHDDCCHFCAPGILAPPDACCPSPVAMMQHPVEPHLQAPEPPPYPLHAAQQEMGPLLLGGGVSQAAAFSAMSVLPPGLLNDEVLALAASFPKWNDLPLDLKINSPSFMEMEDYGQHGMGPSLIAEAKTDTKAA